MRRAQAVARLGSWELDLQARTVWASDEAFRIYGLEVTPNHELPTDIVKAIPLPEYRPVLDQALADLFAGTQPYDLRFHIRRHDDGAIRAVHSFAEVHRDEAGEPHQVTGTIQDVTEQEAKDLKTLTALRASEESARLAFEQAVDAIFIGNEAGDILSVNGQALVLTGYTREELLAGNARMLYSPELLQANPMQYERVIAGAAVTTERLLTRKDGTLVPVEVHACRLSNGTLQAIMRDISERRRFEEQLELRDRMDSVGALARGIAHDFNNILVIIMGHAELLRSDSGHLSTAQREDIEAILQACRRAADLVQGLQVASREAPSEAGDFDLGQVATEVCAVVRETTDRVVSKELRIPVGRFTVRGTRTGVHHALMNLLVNAVQAVEKKGPVPTDRVVLSADEHLAETGSRLGLRPGRWVHVTVSDTGAGMKEEVRRHAFDPLFTTMEKGVRKGQGLGLAMVYNVVVRQQGGAIEVESDEGKGTIFHLYLPAGEAHPSTERPAATVTARGSETILVVDDEEFIRKVARRVLEAAGYRVIDAADGIQALETFGPSGEGIDLVLLDCTLPRLRGEHVLQRMRSLRPNVRVVISSGEDLGDVTTYPGAAAVLPKPYGSGQLLAAVREGLEGGVRGAVKATDA